MVARAGAAISPVMSKVVASRRSGIGLDNGPPPCELAPWTHRLQATTMRFVDLSAPIAAVPGGAPELLRTEIDVRRTTRAARATIEAMFGVRPRAAARRRGLGGRDVHCASARTTPRTSTRRGTTTRRVGGARAADDRRAAARVVLRARRRARLRRAAPTATRSTPTTCEPRWSASATRSRRCDIVLVRTGRDAFYAEPDYMARGPGVTAEATRWLYEQGVRVMGIDAWGWDAPAAPAGRRRRRSAASRASSGPPIRPTCRTRRSSGSCNLGAAARRRLHRRAASRCASSAASAGPTRVVAIIED